MTHCGGSLTDPLTPPPGLEGCQRRCHGRRLFAGARSRAAATDGAGGGGGATSGETAQSCAVSSAARARRTRIAAPSHPPQ